MRGSIPLRILNFFGIALFALFAWFQRNDIDPEIYYKPSGLDATLWFAFYGLISCLFVVTLFRRIPIWILVAATIACLAEMITTAPGLFTNLFGEKNFTMTQVSMSAEDPRVELTREFFGAAIALAGVLFLWWQQRRLSPAGKPTDQTKDSPSPESESPA